MHVYDADAQKWVDLTGGIGGTIPTARSHFGISSVANFLYLFGGWSAAGNFFFCSGTFLRLIFENFVQACSTICFDSILTVCCGLIYQIKFLVTRPSPGMDILSSRSEIFCIFSAVLAIQVSSCFGLFVS
jgi:hypothetical protein